MRLESVSKEQLAEAFWNLFLQENEHIFNKELHLSHKAKALLFSLIEKENPLSYQTLFSALGNKTNHLACNQCNTFCKQQCFFEEQQINFHTPLKYLDWNKLERYFDYGGEREFTYWRGSPLFFQFKSLIELL